MDRPNRFRVYASRLKDSPYTAGEDEWPLYQEANVSSLADEIVNGNNTCYLVSGYRGVGKTSFILQVQERAERLTDEIKNKTIEGIPSEKIPECLFVLTNFAKYENQKSLLRRMIRDVYQVYKKSDRVRDEQEKIFSEKIEDLYKRTFQDIKTQLSETNTTEIKVTGEAAISDKIKKFLPSILQLLISGAGSAYLIGQLMIAPAVQAVILGICFAIWFIFSLIDVKAVYNRSSSTESKSTIEEIYDDEIADFKFQELLDSFQSFHYRVVFVLDELDKVSPDQLDNLIREMKPYLLSGKAHFIIVAGQELAYRYLWAYSGDDAVIGSLFSKFYHIPLFSTDNLEEMGRRLINFDSVSSPDSLRLSPLFDYLIFKCRRVPRSFVARFRQIASWEPDEQNERVAYITIPDKQITYLQVRTLAIIKEIERVSITPKQHEPVLHDYLITQLFINAQQMIFKKDFLQSVNEYLQHYKESGELADKAYYQNVEEIITELFARMKQENIILESVAEIKNETIDSPTGAKEESSQVASQENMVISDRTTSEELVKFRIEWLSLNSALALFWADEVKRDPSLAGKPAAAYDILDYFNSIKAISFSPVQEKSLIDLINKTYLLEGEDQLRSFRDQLRRYLINPIGFERQLTEFVIRKQLQFKIGSGYNEQILTGFDAAFITGNSTQPDLLIDFRHSDSAESDRSDIEKLVEKLSAYNSLAKKGNILPVIETFFNTGAINQDLLIQSFNSAVESYNPFYYKKIIYLPVQSRIENDTFEKLADECIAGLSPYCEFSIQERIEEKKKTLPLLGTVYDPEDPQKYLWGGKPKTTDRTLSATVIPIGKSEKFAITLTVTGSVVNPLLGFVYFLVHPTFPEEIYKVLVKNNTAILKLDGFEAFTTGAVCDEGGTELELDLNKLENVPKEFHYEETIKSNTKKVTTLPSRSKSVRKKMKK